MVRPQRQRLALRIAAVPSPLAVPSMMVPASCVCVMVNISVLSPTRFLAVKATGRREGVMAELQVIVEYRTECSEGGYAAKALAVRAADRMLPKVSRQENKGMRP